MNYYLRQEEEVISTSVSGTSQVSVLWSAGCCRCEQAKRTANKEAGGETVANEATETHFCGICLHVHSCSGKIRTVLKYTGALLHGTLSPGFSSSILSLVMKI